jgi:hypothetical protein
MSGDHCQVPIHQWNDETIPPSTFETQLQRFGDGMDGPRKRSFEAFLQQNRDMVESVGAFFDKSDAGELQPAKKRRLSSPQGNVAANSNRRINKTAPLGNNRFGRKGNLGCEACRKRKRKVRIP